MMMHIWYIPKYIIDRNPRSLNWKVAGGNQARGWDAADLDTAILFCSPYGLDCLSTITGYKLFYWVKSRLFSKFWKWGAVYVMILKNFVFLLLTSVSRTDKLRV